VKSVLDSDDTADEDEDDNDEHDKDETDDANFKDDKDEGFKRVRNILDMLLDQGRRALASKPDDFEGGSKSTTKVLHMEELRSWRSLDEGDFRTPSIANDRHSDSDDNASLKEPSHKQSEADINHRDNNDQDSEDEVEGIVSIKIIAS
jgi:hypothetical protein